MGIDVACSSYGNLTELVNPHPGFCVENFPKGKSTNLIEAHDANTLGYCGFECLIEILINA